MAAPPTQTKRCTCHRYGHKQKYDENESDKGTYLQTQLLASPYAGWKPFGVEDKERGSNLSDELHTHSGHGSQGRAELENQLIGAW